MQSTLRPTLRHGAILLALLAGVGVAATQDGTVGTTDGLATPPGASDITGSLGPAAATPSPKHLPLSDEQLSRVHDGVMRADAPTANVAEPEAASVPSHVALQALPEPVIRDVPLLKGYSFVKLDDRILVVSPATRLVVAEIPRYQLLQ
jgi:hypothetical protein